MSKIIGWDIGGAHLKAVLISEHAPHAMQLSCELWRGLDKLESAINQALNTFGVNPNEAQHAVTMTGELVDLFASRREGVVAIANCVENLLGVQPQFYAASLGFVPSANVATYALEIASANWHASASLLATRFEKALFVDIGSTTTDIVPIVAGQVQLSACSDAARMANDSLVYTGVVRTPIMALAAKVNFEGVQVNVAAEYFATMADVYRLTGDLEHDAAETADGKGKTLLESARRLARMIGHDVEELALQRWQALAHTYKQLQLNQIQTAVLKHLPREAPIIGAGAGEFLIKEIAATLDRPYMTVADALKIALNNDLSVCFPAYAVARLAQGERQ